MSMINVVVFHFRKALTCPCFCSQRDCCDVTAPGSIVQHLFSTIKVLL
jgi:hypothetical protein